MWLSNWINSLTHWCFDDITYQATNSYIFSNPDLFVSLCLTIRLCLSASQDGKMIVWDTYSTNKVLSILQVIYFGSMYLDLRLLWMKGNQSTAPALALATKLYFLHIRIKHGLKSTYQCNIYELQISLKDHYKHVLICISKSPFSLFFTLSTSQNNSISWTCSKNIYFIYLFIYNVFIYIFYIIYLYIYIFFF